MVVDGLMADPGLPERLTGGIDASLQDALTGWSGSADRWKVEVSEDRLPLDEDGAVPLMDRSEEIKKAHEWDLLVYVTDLPRVHHQQTLLTESDASLGSALVSLPALGGLRVRRALHDELLRVIQYLAASGDMADKDCDTTRSNGCDDRDPGGNDTSESDAGAGRDPEEQGHLERDYITVGGRRGRLKLLVGMVRSNQPGRLVGSLASAAAAAMAAGAFGIFYTSIWNMADSSSTLRLSMISLLAIVVLTTWLVAHNGLWSSSRTGPNGTPVALDNSATVVTVLISVAAMYAALYAVVFLGALAVIPAHFMEAQLDHPVSFPEYANLSWLSASLGILAGALGSNFDADAEIQRATYSGREHQRRQLEREDRMSAGR